MTLEILTSEDLAPARHGFFTRRGGASSGVYQGLNCGPGSSDQRAAVGLNRQRVAEAMDVDPPKLLSLQQYHSAEVVVAGPEGWEERPKADGMVTKHEGIALAVLTADCAPVLFADSDAGVIGAAHAGWRGAFGGVLEETVAAMVRLGAERGSISAVVGPTISQRNYEVGEEFFEEFLAEGPEYTQFFVNGRAPGKYQFDLPGFVLWRLREAGVGSAAWIRACTYSEPDRFFSYRRSTHLKEPDYGRLISAIAL
ncbi:peptidoglycan editing factor PgeF [Amaricoccus macauensis]|uniref:peptidoglycan editing factor PgeF n=1 Tax=Amaricoccus macauensis TaxID=57001 RepID=UPI003C79A030